MEHVTTFPYKTSLNHMVIGQANNAAACPLLKNDLEVGATALVYARDDDFNYYAQVGLVSGTSERDSQEVWSDWKPGVKVFDIVWATRIVSVPRELMAGGSQRISNEAAQQVTQYVLKNN